MNKYIGTELIEAEPENRTIPKEYCDNGNVGDLQQGYKVRYPDGYVSWSPKEVFEKTCIRVTPNLKLKSDISISEKMVDNFIKETHVDTVGDKTTVVIAILRNGFEIVEASTCVDKNNYDEKLGSKICMNKIKDKVCYLLGFLLQTAKNGVNYI